MKNVFLLILMVKVAFSSQATIVYTDISPDYSTTLDANLKSSNKLISIDFNGDGNEEYNFAWIDSTMSTTKWLVNIDLFGNEVNLDGSITSPSGAGYMLPMTFGSSINTTGYWGASSPPPLVADNNNDNFLGKGDRYIGVKFDLGASVHFGWILINFTSGKKLTIKEYAYESTANTSIDAGAKTSPIIYVTSITVQGAGGATTITTLQGELQMEATVLPINATNKFVTWSVTNGTGSATISSSGLLTAVSDGGVSVKATADDLSGVSGSISIVISNQTVKVESINVYGKGGVTTISSPSGSLQMEADVLPANATNKTVTWSVLSGIATINSSGLLTAIENDTVTVKATANDGSGISGTTSIIISNQIMAVKELSTKATNFHVFPNPSINYLIIESALGDNLGMITIRTVEGKVISKSLVSNPMGKITVSNLNRGMYYLTVDSMSSASLINTYKFIKL